MSADFLGLAIGLLLVVIALVALFTIVIIVASYGIAKRKGYSGWLGVVLTLFFHFVGFLVVLVLPRRSTVARAFSAPPRSEA